MSVTEQGILLADTKFNDVSAIKHGFAPKAPNDVTKFLDGTGVFSVPTILTSLSFKIDSAGVHSWGPGNGTYDTNLYRVAAGVLKTDGSFQSVGGITAGVGLTNQISLDSSQGRIYIGGAADVYLYRSAVGTFKTDGVMVADQQFNVAVVTTARTGGAAAALPANPVSYIPVLDSAGNRRYVPAYS